MPKFHSITIDVEEVAVGYVMRLLHNTPGVAKVHYNLDEAGTNKTNGKALYPNAGRLRRNYGITGHDLIVQLLVKENRPMRTGELQDLFERAGRSRGAVNSSTHMARQQEMIESTPEGYVLTRKMKDRLRHRKEA